MRFFVPKILLFLASVVGSQLLLAAAQPGGSVNKGQEGVAVKGYDVVAYFDQKKPMEGDPKYSYEYNGAKYNFVSSEHLALFAKSPEAYLPQYGGYCAVGTSMGHKADIDPESWAVIDNKLYLNSSKGAQKLFDKDPQAAIKQADRNWVKLK